MKEKNKKIIIGLIILAIVIILCIILFNRKENVEERLETVELTELLDVQDIKSIKYETKKSDEEISSKYVIGKNKYEVKANIQAGETEGKMIFVREEYEKLNIYKTEYKINKYKDKNEQVNNIMQEFENICEEYIGILNEYEETENLYGESNAKFDLPIEESIYSEERLYSKTYKNETKQYDINFYKKGENIICELVVVL